MFYSLDSNPYHILEVTQQATQTEIKQAYRRLVKRFHPDSQRESANHDKIIQVNAAYEVLSDPQRRRQYDQQRLAAYPSVARQQRTAEAQYHYQRRRQAEQRTQIQLDRWLEQVYTPVNRLVSRILVPLATQIDRLAADPFDDELMAEFQSYLAEAQNYLTQAKQLFVSLPNPPTVAKVAQSLYYCLNQLEDGIDELEQFTLNYDDGHLHTGQELLSIARRLRTEAREWAAAIAL